MSKVPDRFRADVIAMAGGDPARSYTTEELGELLAQWVESLPAESTLLRKIYAEAEKRGMVPPYSSSSH